MHQAVAMVPLSNM